MKMNFGGIDVEMTVKEFAEFIKLFEVEKDATQEINSLKHWGVAELEFDSDGYATAKLVQKSDAHDLNKYGNRMSYVEAMGRFWKAKLSDAE